MWYEDLPQCDYFNEEYSHILTAVGWLENDRTFPTGRISKDVYLKLCDARKNPWTFIICAGPHECSLCQFNGETGISNIFIPHKGKIYVCPELITHYINAHFYLPPQEFIEAVIACPPQGSMEYLKKMLENGGRELVRSMKGNK